MGKYHNKLDKKYFNKSIYIKKFESAFGVKILSGQIRWDGLLKKKEGALV